MSEPIMRDYEVFAVTVIILAVLGLAGGLGGCYMVEKTNQTAIKAGLVQKPYGAGNIWTTPDSK